MKKQMTFSDLEHANKQRKTRREQFLEELDAVTPWARLVAEIEPFYPKDGGRGRPTKGLERMLRMYLVQNCLGLADEATEDAIYDSVAVCRFVGIDLSRERAPDATTLLHFRRLLETHGLTERILAAINGHLAEQGLMLRQGTVVDATIINAPSSTKNRDKARDPEMHQTKKGNQWYFGCKAHIGVDEASGLVHSVSTTAANVADVTETHKLLHGEESRCFGDAGYRGVDKREETQSLGPEFTWYIAMGPSTRRALGDDELGQLQRFAERLKASMRAKVEHAFQVVKQRFGHRKLRYKGLEKNHAHHCTLFALANLVRVRKRLLADPGLITS
jgi:IS5 family transposase